jgi:MFS family permease
LSIFFGQGLVFPIINTLMMDQETGFPPVSAPMATREFNYGLVIGIFFLCWFLGAAYIAKVSDAIGRKNAILICLFGALFGYILTIVSLFIDSLWLLIVGRAITGFTAGNQPIAQAAVVDMRATDTERARNMGYIVAGISAGLVGGPTIGGVLSDKEIVGGLASLTLPFYFALALVAITIVLILVFVQGCPSGPRKIPLRAARNLHAATADLQASGGVPAVGSVLLLHACECQLLHFLRQLSDRPVRHRALRHQYGDDGAGDCRGDLQFAACRTGPATSQQEHDRRGDLRGHGGQRSDLHPRRYATGLLPDDRNFLFRLRNHLSDAARHFSASVGEDEQGWVMGITTAQFTLAAGIVSLVGGDLMGVDLRFPVFVTIAAAPLALLMMILTWRTAAIRQITQM